MNDEQRDILSSKIDEIIDEDLEETKDDEELTEEDNRKIKSIVKHIIIFFSISIILIIYPVLIIRKILK